MIECRIDVPLESVVPGMTSKDPGPMEYTGPLCRCGRHTPMTDAERTHSRRTAEYNHYLVVGRFARAMAEERMRLIVEQVSKELEDGTPQA